MCQNLDGDLLKKPLFGDSHAGLSLNLFIDDQQIALVDSVKPELKEPFFLLVVIGGPDWNQKRRKRIQR